MAKRRAIRLVDRFEVFKRDEFACQYCGRTPPGVLLQIDHVVAVAAGGDNTPDNLVTSCVECNIGKGAKELGAIRPIPSTERTEELRERAEQLRQYNAVLLARRKAEEETVTRIGSYWFEMRGEPGFVFGHGRVPSIKTFLRFLTEAEILDAADIALDRFGHNHSDTTAWKYFCGVCWKRIRTARGEQV